MANRKPLVRHKDMALLRVAVMDAKGWRGSLHPDDWLEFDEKIAEMEEALRRVRLDRQSLSKLLRAQS